MRFIIFLIPLVVCASALKFSANPNVNFRQSSGGIQYFFSYSISGSDWTQQHVNALNQLIEALKECNGDWGCVHVQNWMSANSAIFSGVDWEDIKAGRSSGGINIQVKAVPFGDGNAQTVQVIDDGSFTFNDGYSQEQVNQLTILIKLLEGCQFDWNCEKVQNWLTQYGTTFSGVDWNAIREGKSSGGITIRIRVTKPGRITHRHIYFSFSGSENQNAELTILMKLLEKYNFDWNSDDIQNWFAQYGVHFSGINWKDIQSGKSSGGLNIQITQCGEGNNDLILELQRLIKSVNYDMSSSVIRQWFLKYSSQFPNLKWEQLISQNGHDIDFDAFSPVKPIPTPALTISSPRPQVPSTLRPRPLVPSTTARPRPLIPSTTARPRPLVPSTTTVRPRPLVPSTTARPRPLVPSTTTARPRPLVPSTTTPLPRPLVPSTTPRPRPLVPSTTTPRPRPLVPSTTTPLPRPLVPSTTPRPRPLVPSTTTARPRPLVPSTTARPRPLVPSTTPRPRPLVPSTTARPRPLIPSTTPRPRPLVPSTTTPRPRPLIPSTTPRPRPLVPSTTTPRPRPVVPSTTPRPIPLVPSTTAPRPTNDGYGFKFSTFKELKQLIALLSEHDDNWNSAEVQQWIIKYGANFPSINWKQVTINNGKGIDWGELWAKANRFHFGSEYNFRFDSELIRSLTECVRESQQLRDIVAQNRASALKLKRYLQKTIKSGSGSGVNFNLILKAFDGQTIDWENFFIQLKESGFFSTKGNLFAGGGGHTQVKGPTICIRPGSAAPGSIAPGSTAPGSKQ